MPRARKQPPVKNLPYGTNRAVNEAISQTNQMAPQVTGAGLPANPMPMAPAADPMAAARDFQLINEADLLTAPTARPNEDLMAGISGQYVPPTPQPQQVDNPYSRLAATFRQAYAEYPTPALAEMIRRLDKMEAQ